MGSMAVMRRGTKARIARWASWAGVLLCCVALAIATPAAAEEAKSQFKQGVKAYEAGEYVAAFKVWLPLAYDDDPAAQRNLGHLYRMGLGVAQDFTKAADWYTRAAELGLTRAQANLGNMYLRGQGVEQDYEEALHWFERAAAQGHPISQYNMGLMYEAGLGIDADDAEAVKWFYLASKGGHAKALSKLALLISRNTPPELAQKFTGAADRRLAERERGRAVTKAASAEPTPTESDAATAAKESETASAEDAAETAAATEQSTAPSAPPPTGEPAETLTSVEDTPADAPAISAAPIEAVTTDELPAVPELPAETAGEPAATAATEPSQIDPAPSLPGDTDAGEETITEEPTPVVAPTGPTELTAAEPEAAAPSESAELEEEKKGFFASLFTVRKPSISPGLETRSGGLVKSQRDRSLTGGPTADEDETQLAGVLSAPPASEGEAADDATEPLEEAETIVAATVEKAADTLVTWH